VIGRPQSRPCVGRYSPAEGPWRRMYCSAERSLVVEMTARPLLPFHPWAPSRAFEEPSCDAGGPKAAVSRK